MILGRYLDIEPSEIRFVTNEHGKPSLTPELSPDLKFNLSHSDNVMLCAIAADRDVGVDVECVRPDVAGEPGIERWFHPDEVSALHSAAAAGAHEVAFFSLWTRKEAFVKAMGRRLDDGLGRSTLTELTEWEPNIPPAAMMDPDRDCWAVKTFIPQPGYVASLVVQGTSWRLRCCDHQGPSHSSAR
jgi:4'-phosphopantetheinyl transferase